jgi:hypothetical protein
LDLSKLKTTDWVIVASAIVLFIASFLDWFSIDTQFGTAAGNGWDVGFFWAGIPVLIGLAMLAVVAIRAFSPETRLPDLPIGWGQALFIAGLIPAFIVVLKLLIGHEELGFDFDRNFGIYLAAIAAVGLAVGGLLKWQEERSAGGAGSVEGPGTAPPTPF